MMTENTPKNKDIKIKKVTQLESQIISTEASTSKGDVFKFCLAIVLIIGGLWLFYEKIYSIPQFLRILAVVTGIILGLLVIFFWCNSGRKLITYIRDSISEFKKVVWPTRNNAFRMTIFVIIFVAILAVFIYMADSIISWLFYDVLLKRG